MQNYVPEDDTVSEDDSETVLSVPGRGFEPESGLKFQSVPVIWALFLQLAVMVGFCVLLFVGTPAEFYPIEEDAVFLFSVLLHVIVLVFLVLMYFYVRYFFRRVRSLGHLEFYRSSVTLRSAPVLILSVGNTAILVLICLWARDEEYAGLARINVLQAIVVIETFFIAIDLFLLARKVYKFNVSKPPPDASEELVPGFEAVNVNQGQRISTDLGFSEEDYLDDVMAKQGDMIKYLQQQKENLSLRIVQLTERLRHYEQQSADNPNETDFQYLLKAKDQEMRVTLAERNQTIQRLEAQVRELQQQRR